ncbi:MAG TPA: nuclear transport factor 2 family protein [Steroidobacteraceae bacterium]|nr:nuclear transport factor 2 family protein [Steroidobacteraceae bacterium]
MNSTSYKVEGDRGAVVRKILAAMSRGVSDPFDGYLADDAIYHLTGSHRFAGRYEGRAALLGLLRGVATHFDEHGIRYEVARVLEAGDTVVATFKGLGKLSKGGDYSNDYCAIWDFKDGKVVKITEYFDSDHVCRAMVPA